MAVLHRFYCVFFCFQELFDPYSWGKESYYDSLGEFHPIWLHGAQERVGEYGIYVDILIYSLYTDEFFPLI